MRENMNPKILFIDDSSSTTPQLLKRVFDPRRMDVRLIHPEDVTDPDLAWANVVVIDYFLTDWSERTASPSASRAPEDGLAVAATLRSRLLPGFDQRYPGSLPERPVAFALWSGHLSEATFGLPDVVLPHVFSRENNLDWAFSRTELLASGGADQLASLAQAVTSLPGFWTQQDRSAEDALWASMGLSAEVPWSEDARENVLDCRPPLHELALRTRGMAILRWLLHRILPYPTFLMNEQQVCARLRVDGLSAIGTDRSTLLDELQAVAYQGVLHGFAGPRWWRAGVESYLFDSTQGRSGDPSTVADMAISKGARSNGRWLRPVVVLDETLKPKPDFEEVDSVLRINPDDWPPYADDAFASREDARELPELRRLVHPADRHLLEILDFGDKEWD